MHYHIIAIDPKAHLFEVTQTISTAKPHQILSLPSWLPGSYMIRDFARNLIDIKAVDNNEQPIEVLQLDKQTWQCQNSENFIKISYQVYAWDLSVRSAHLDTTHGFFNGSSVFLCAKELEETKHTLTIEKPALDELKQWKLATSMKRTAGEQFGFGEFYADNYDDFIDHPVEMGELTIESFEACGVPHDVVLSGKHRASMPRICKDLKAICEYQINLFGGNAPFERYVFLTTVLGNGFGGLEHRASTALMCSRKDLPTNMEHEVNKDYRVYLSLCSHEYFHSWNVKRIKPAEFTPFDLSKEAYTEQLWAYEGITSYFDDFLTYRSGCVDQTQYLTMLSEIMTRVYRSQGRFKQTLKSSSFNAWTKFYKQDENANNAIVSYYTKGALFALYLDLTIRLETNGKQSLDDVMRELWQDYGSKNIGTQIDTHQQIIESLLNRNCDDLFAYLDNTQDIPLKPLLEKVGITMRLRASAGNTDLGGGDVSGNKIAFGAKTKPESIGLKVLTVAQASPAHQAGLSAGDLLIAANNLQVDAQFEAQLQTMTVGEELLFHWFRRDELMQGVMPINESVADTISLEIQDKNKLSIWL
ncbi:M61 family metallopeptidase [Shewanella goraebulensis]|uniref:M61 family metallopeptidase n=1 Tax=Shewanella goraebulensis TaxID=3050637 RepID=UPI00254C9EAB|nr:PDZ domain-containing protein [Shewanella goraebulensis]